jgi:predicted ATPase
MIEEIITALSRIRCRADRRSARHKHEPSLSRGARSSRRAPHSGSLRSAFPSSARAVAADYLALAERFAAVIVEGIPQLSSEQRDASTS